MRIFKQVIIVARVFVQSIPDRLGMTSAVFFSTAIVVAVLLAFLSLGKGFKTTLERTGSDSVAIVLKEGASSELSSSIGSSTASIIEDIVVGSTKVSRDRIMHDTYMVVDGLNESTKTSMNVALRGVRSNPSLDAKRINLIEGRIFNPGSNEVVIGSSLQKKLYGADIGQLIELGNHQWKVVGVFSSSGSVYESEVWADISTTQSFFGRGSDVQVIRFPIDSSSTLLDIKLTADRDARLDLKIITERDYYKAQAGSIANFIFYLGWPISILMALGALSSAVSAMYNSVSAKKIDIATLRAIGFGNAPVFFGVMIESLMITFLGGILGVVVSYLAFHGMTAMTLGGGMSQVVFKLTFSFESMMYGVLMAILIGGIGGVLPAFSCSRVLLANAFREI